MEKGKGSRKYEIRNRSESPPRRSRHESQSFRGSCNGSRKENYSESCQSKINRHGEHRIKEHQSRLPSSDKPDGRESSRDSRNASKGSASNRRSGSGDSGSASKSSASNGRRSSGDCRSASKGSASNRRRGSRESRSASKGSASNRRRGSRESRSASKGSASNRRRGSRESRSASKGSASNRRRGSRHNHLSRRVKQYYKPSRQSYEKDIYDSTRRSASEMNTNESSSWRRHRNSMQREILEPSIKVQGETRDKVETNQVFEKIKTSTDRKHTNDNHSSQSQKAVAGSSRGSSNSQQKFKLQEADLIQFQKILFQPPTPSAALLQMKNLKDQITLIRLTEVVRAIFKTFYFKKFRKDPHSPNGICVNELKAYIIKERERNRRWLGMTEEKKLRNGSVDILDISALRILIQGMLGADHPVVHLVAQICNKRNELCHDLHANGVIFAASTSKMEDDWVDTFLNEFEKLFHVEKSFVEEIPRRLDAHKEFPYKYISYKTKLLFSITFLVKGELNVANKMLDLVFEEMEGLQEFDISALVKLSLYFKSITDFVKNLVNTERFVGKNFAHKLLDVSELNVKNRDEFQRLVDFEMDFDPRNEREMDTCVFLNNKPPTHNRIAIFIGYSADGISSCASLQLASATNNADNWVRSCSELKVLQLKCDTEQGK